MKELFARNKNELHKIELNEVYYFTKRDGKVLAVSKNFIIEITVSLYSISELLGKSPSFFRCHKSFIINLTKIDIISKFNNKAYNISFKDIKDQVYITQRNLKILTEKISIV
jgi:DNA-binding LytR/AlgR family response regulator